MFINQWLKNSAAEPLSVPPGLVRLVFDNEQVIGKRYRVKANKASVSASVITSHASIMIDKDNFIQYQDDYKPSTWLYDDRKMQTAAGDIIDLFDEHEEIFRASQNTFIDSRIAYIRNEVKGDSDLIDDLVKKNV